MESLIMDLPQLKIKTYNHISRFKTTRSSEGVTNSR